MNALEIKNLYKRYSGFTLDNINLTLPSGCIMGLVGENGAGKSTIIKLILDIINSDGGSVTILGENDVQLVKDDIGVVLDNVGIPECLTAKQVGKIMKNIYKNWEEETYQNLLNKFSIPDNQQFKKFSHGTKMKLGIAIAMSHKAKLLILDEATNGLDPYVRDEVIGMFGEFTRDESHAVLISSHIVSDLEKICDYIAFLHKGRLILCEEKDRLKEQYCIVHCTAEQLNDIEPTAIIGQKQSNYGVEVLVKRDSVPANWEIASVDIEQLFIFMLKEVY